MIFLSTIPRSGSTLLTSLLNQRPDVYATPTSNLCDTIGGAIYAWQKNLKTIAQNGTNEELLRVVKGMLENRYDTDKLVFDKTPNWASPIIVKTLSLIQDVKIVTTVRPIAEVIASAAKISKSKDIELFLKTEFFRYIIESYANISECYKLYPEKMLLIEYDNLVSNTQKELDRVSDFVGLDKFIHPSEVPDSAEDDKAWGIKDLHKVRSKVSKINYSAKEILGEKLYNYYQGNEFWNNKPEPKRFITPIIKQHNELMLGNFEKSKKLAYENLLKYPDDTDISFNAGWYKLSEGDVENGYKLLDKGRATSSWGDSFISPKPIWNGEKGTVLLKLERGLGDQIHQVRYAKQIKEAGCTVVVSCSPELVILFNTISEVDVVVCHDSALGVYHDFYLPAMSAPLYLKYKTNDNIDGTSYIPKPKNIEVVKGRIGLRWQGFSGYEHQTQRKFPPKLMFDAVKDQNCISLQRDESTELRPRWVKDICLDTWEDTAEAITSCELVITSCTSVAHLSGAMGVPTWVVIPRVSYYLWTYPGSKTPYYNSMTLYRQIEKDNWESPFKLMNFTKGLENAA